MRTIYFSIGILSLLTFHTGALAAESTSYKLYNEFPNYGARDAGASPSYQMDESGISWYGVPLTGSTYQIVTGTPVVEESTSSGGNDDSGGSTSSTDHSGRRPRPIYESSSSESQVSSASSRPRPALSSSSSSSTVPFETIDFVPGTAPEIPDTGNAFPLDEKVICEINYFVLTDDQLRDVKRAQLHASAYTPVQTILIIPNVRNLSLLLLLNTLALLVLLYVGHDYTRRVALYGQKASGFVFGEGKTFNTKPTKEPTSAQPTKKIKK